MELLNAGHDAVIVDNLYNSSEKVIARVEELTGKHVKFYRADAWRPCGDGQGFQ